MVLSIPRLRDLAGISSDAMGAEAIESLRDAAVLVLEREADRIFSRRVAHKEVRIVPARAHRDQLQLAALTIESLIEVATMTDDDAVDDGWQVLDASCYRLSGDWLHLSPAVVGPVRIRVTYTGGWSIDAVGIPADLLRAVAMQASWSAARNQAGSSLAALNPKRHGEYFAMMDGHPEALAVARRLARWAV